MAAAKPFIERLQQLGLLDENILAQLRQQVAEAKGPIMAETIAKVLVDNGHLTVFQAKKIISDITAPPSEKTPPTKPTTPPPAPPAKKPAEEELTLAHDSGLVPLESPTPSSLPPPTPTPAPTKTVVKARPISPTAEKKSVFGPPPPKKSQPPAVEGLVPLTDDLQPLTLGTDDLLSGPGLESVSALETSSPLMGPKPSGGLLTSLFNSDTPTKSKNPWDSMLIYVGGGALAILVFAFVLLYFALARGTASDAYQLAEDDYQSQAYSQAIAKYEKFLARHATDANASLARVRIGMSQIHLAVGEGRNWPQILATTQDTLTRIQGEEKFDEARAELADILPRIADALAIEAKRSTGDIPKAKEYLEQCEQALELVNSGANIPAHLRTPVEAKVAVILEEVALVRRDINRDAELKGAIAAINTAIESGQTSEAYEARRQLLKKYPGLDVNAELAAATQNIANKERELVQVSAQMVEPVAAAAEPWSEYVLAQRAAPTMSLPTGEQVAVTVKGAVYGIDVASGRLLWKRHVGNGPMVQPVAAAATPTPDWLVVDTTDGSLLRLGSASGESKWRLPLMQSCFAPVVIEQHAVATAPTGRIVSIDLGTGQATRFAQLPQGAAQSAAYEPRRNKLYQLGEHSTLFVLSGEDLACREAFFVGHGLGAIAVPPVAVGGQVLIAENAGADYCLIHVLSTDADGLNLTRKQSHLRLPGNVVAPAVVDGRRVYYFTNLGAAHVFDIDPANTSEPVSVVAKLTASRSEPLISFATAADSKVWVADDRLTQYDLQPARGDLARRWSHFTGDTFLGPPVRIGNVLVHTRLRRNAGDLAFAASNVSDGQLLWQTTLPGALATVAATPAGLQALTAQGAVFALNKPGIVDTPATSHTAPSRGVWPVTLGADRWALLSHDVEAQWQLVQVGADPKTTLVKFKGDAARPSTPGAAFENGLALALSSGQIVLVDPAGGQPLLLPFVPKQSASSAPTWRALTALSGVPALLAAADDQEMLYLLARKETPQPHLSALQQTSAGGTIAAQLAPFNKELVTVVLRDHQHVLQSFTLPELKPSAALALSSAIAWGPQAVDDALYMVTDLDGLVCVDTGLQTRWKLPLEGANLVSVPLALGSSTVIITSQGDVWLVESGTGQVKQRLRTRLPLGGTALLHEGNLLITGADGAVYSIPTAQLNTPSTP